MNEISIPVKLQIQNLQSLMNELQGKLSNLKVGSTGFKNLQNIISAIGSEIDRLQIQTSKPFMSEAQFRTAERSVEKLEDQIEKLGLSVSRIKFSDLNLTPQQQSDIKGFEDQLESIKTNLKMVKDTAKQEFLNTDLGKQWATIDSTAFSKSLSQITANIRTEVNKQEKELERLQTAATSYQNAIAQNKKINDFLQKTNKDPISIGSMGEDLYNQLFDKLKRLKGGKNGGRKLIEEWLQNELELDPEIISKLVKNLHGDNLSAQLTAALQKMMKDNTAVIKANPTAEVDFKQKEQEIQNLINILREAGVSEQSVTIAEQALRQQLDNTKQSLNEYQQAAARTAQEQMNIDSTTAAFKSQLTSLRSTLDQTNAKFLQMQRTTQSFNQMKMAITNFMGFNQVLNITKNAVREAMNHIKDLDTVMNGISIVTDMTTDDLWKQVDAYSEMAQNYGVSIKGAYEVSQIYYQQGLETNDVLTLTNETLKLAKISGLDYAQTTDYMTTALRGFKMEMSDASTIVDVYSNLAANTAVSQEELAVAMSKTASSMESVGSTFEDTSAMIATMVAVTRESATNIGSAMKSIASRYGELTKDPTKLVDADGEVMAFNKVDSALQSVGISMKTVDGQFRNFTDVIVELADKWNQLESTQQRYIATQFAGNRQQSRFLALVSNKDILKANMEVANNSEDVGTLQALKALDSIEAKTEQVRVAYQQFYTTIGMQDVWKTFLDGTKNVINTLNSLPKLFNSIPIGAVAAIANTISLVKTLLNAGLNILANNFKNLLSDSFNQAEQSSKDGGTKAGRSWWQSVIQEIRTGKPAIQAEMSEAMNPTNQQSITPNMSNTINNSASGKFTNFVKALGNSGTKLHGIMTGLSSVLTTVGMIIKKDTVEGQKFAGTITSIGGTLQGLTGIIRAVMNPADLGGWLQAAQGVMNLVNGIGLAWETTEEKLERLNKEAEELSNNAKEVKANYNILDKSVKKLNELKDKQYESEEAAEEYKSVMNEIAEKYPELIQGFDEVGNAIVDVDEAERQLAEARRETAKATYEALEKERQAQKQSLNNQKEIIQEKAIKDSSSLIQANKQTSIQSVFDDDINVKGLEEIFENYLNKWYPNTVSNRNAIMEDNNQILINFLTSPSTSDELFSALENINTYSELKTYFESLPGHIKSLFETTNSGLTELLSKYGIGKDFEIDTSSFDIVASFLENLSTFNGSKEDIKNFKLFKVNYNKLSNEQKDLLGLTDTYVEELTEQIQTYLQEFNKYASTDKLTIQSWLKYSQAEKEGYDWINTSSYSLILLSERLSELAEGQEYESIDAFMEGDKAATDIVEAYNNFYNGLNETQKEIYEKYLKDRSSYTEEDLWKSLEEAMDPSKSWSGPSPEVKKIVEKGIESTEQSKEKIKAYYEGIKEPLEQTTNLYNSIRDSNSNISSEYSQLINQALEEVQAAEDTNLATNLSTAYQELFKEINEATPEIRNIIVDTILGGNLLTKEGILDILSKLKQTSPEAASHVEEYLNKISDLRKTNIVSLSQALLADAEEEVEKTGKLLSKANKQMSGKEAASFIDYINGLGLTDESGNLITVDYGDFDPDASGKLVVKDQVLIDLQNAFEKSLFNRLGIVDNAINKYEKLFSQDENTKQISLIEKNINNLEGQQIDAVDGLKDFLESNGIILEELLDESGNISIEGANIIQQKAQEVVNSYNNTVKAYGLLLSSFIQDSKWAQGIYKFDGKEYGEQDLINLVENKNLTKEDTEKRNAQNYVKKAYNTLITDVLKKGFDNINIEDYEGLLNPDDIRQQLSGSYENFIRKYGRFLGLSVDELNDLLIEAIEKDRETTSGAAQEALSKIDFYGKDTAFGSLDDIRNLANAINKPLENLLGQYNESLNQYELKLDNVELDKITNSVDIMFDSIRSVFDSITKYITSGITGKLQYKDITNLNAQLKELGISELKESDFKVTQDGLKLSQQAAIHLYNEIEKIDKIQARIIFSELTKSLETSNEKYKSTVDLLKHVRDLRIEIANLDSKKDSTKKQQYEEELAVAEKILQVRATTEDKSFSFMDNRLEGGLNNAPNYLSAWSKANKTWNEAIKDAQERQKAFAEGTSTLNDFNVYMDPAAFKNIVEALNSAAGQSGKEIEFLGYKLNGQLTNASALIQNAFDNMADIDGTGAKVNLSSLGVGLLDGGKLLGKQAEEAIHEVAKAQIKILDGLIAIMETVVAFEELGNIDVNENGMFDINDVFKGNTYELTDESKKQIQTMVDNDVISDKLKELKIKNTNLLELFKAALQGGEALEKALGELKLSRDDFFKILSKMTEENFDWDPSNVAELFSSLLPDEIIDTSNKDIELVEEGKISFKIDYSKETTQNALKQYKGTEEERKQYLKTALLNYEKGIIELNDKNGKDLMAVLTYNGLITEVTSDKEKTTLTYNGKKYEGTDQKDALTKALLYEGGAETVTVDKSGETVGIINFGSDSAIQMTVGQSGKVKYSLETDNGVYTGDSLDKVKQQYIDSLTANGKSTSEAVLEWDAKVNTNLTITEQIKEAIKMAFRELKEEDLETDILPIKAKSVEIKEIEEVILGDAAKELLDAYELDPIVAINAVLEALNLIGEPIVQKGVDFIEPTELPGGIELLKAIITTLSLFFDGTPESSGITIPDTINPNNLITSAALAALTILTSSDTEIIEGTITIGNKTVSIKDAATAFLNKLIVNSPKDGSTILTSSITLANGQNVIITDVLDAIAQGKINLISQPGGNSIDAAASTITLADGQSISIGEAITGILQAAIDIESPVGGSKVGDTSKVSLVTGTSVNINSTVTGKIAELILEWFGVPNYNTSNVIPQSPIIAETPVTLQVPVKKLELTSHQTEAIEIGRDLLNKEYGYGIFNTVAGDIYDNNNKMASSIGNYLTGLKDMINQGQQLSQIDFSNLDRIDKLSEGNKITAGTESIKGITQEIRNLNTALLENNVDQSNSILDNFNQDMVSNFNAITEAMHNLSESAESLNNIKWSGIVDGINSINAINTPKKESQSVNTFTATTNNELLSSDNSLSKKIQLELELSGDTQAQELIKNDTEIERTIKLDVSDANINEILSKFTLNLTSDSSPDQGGATTSVPQTNVDTSGISAFIEVARNANTELGTLAASAQSIKSDKVDAIQTAQSQIRNDKVVQIAQAAASINTSKAYALADASHSITANGVNQVKNALQNIKGNVAIDVQFDVKTTGDGKAKGTVIDVRSSSGLHSHTGTSAKVTFNKSFAKGSKQTLMGELGPELVVSNGRYFLVGQNGAEMVDLAADAIVFNHLQTEQLLKHGMSSTRGRAVTNERNAVSYATGNVNGGVAMASASAVLAELRKIRALWQSLEKASLSDLGQMAGLGSKGTGSKGGGSGGGSNDKNKYSNIIEPGFIADLERWYNLLRQIEKLEKDINYQEKLRNKIQSDRIINGQAFYESQKKDLANLDREVINMQQLARLQKEYYDKRRKVLEEETNYGKIFTFDENGLMQYNNSAIMRDGTRGGLYALAKLNAQNPDGSSVMSAQSQYALLTAWGFKQDMIYDSSGNKITFGENEEDEESRKRAEDAGYTTAVQTFWDKAEAWKEELDNLYDSYREQQEKILEADTQRNEILKQIVDNQLEVENKIYDAIIDSREAEIEEIQNERDALEETTSKFINGLNKQLNNEREMYQNQQEGNELNKLRRQLGILQRSGGSASQIRSLQQQINEKERNMYFDKQQQQIDMIEEASQLEIEKLDNQIELMNEQLEYQKAQGLLWNQVYDIMRGTPASINQFITQNGKDWQSYSTTKWEEEYRLLNSQITQLTAYINDTSAYRVTWDGILKTVRDAIAGTDEQAWSTYDEAMRELNGNRTEAEREESYNKYIENYNTTADPNYLEEKINQGASELAPNRSNEIYLTPATSSITGWHYDSEGNLIKNSNDEVIPTISKEIVDVRTTSTKQSTTQYIPIDTSFNNAAYQSGYVGTKNDSKVQAQLANNKVIKPIDNYSYATRTGAAQNGSNTTMSEAEWKKYNNKKAKGYSSGGLADYTGLAMVHGSKKKPEAFLNANETKLWKDEVLSGRPGSLTNSLLKLKELINNSMLSINSIVSSQDNGVVIEQAEINMYATIANDYDARRAGENIVDEIMKIARKSSISSIRR